MPECWAGAKELADAKAHSDDLGPTWDIFDIIGCALMSEARRDEVLAEIGKYRATAREYRPPQP